MSEKLTVTVLGGGSFGTAIADIIAHNGHSAYLWMREAETAQRCHEVRENTRYLPGHKLADSLVLTSDLQSCVPQSDLVFVAIPSKAFRGVVERVAPLLKPNTIVISTAKGIEAPDFVLMGDILEQALPNCRVGALSGPNFAAELMAKQYTGSVIASYDESVIQVVKEVLSSPTYRIYRSLDRRGVEIAGALKNIYAIISGMAAALETGSNTQAMLLTRSLAEIGRFARHLGAESETCLGLAGVGDLVLTCTSDQSRNYRLGYALARGQSLETTQAQMGQVVEGVNTLKIVKSEADKREIYMPLVHALYGVLFEGKDIATTVGGLMTGAMTSDVDLQGGSNGRKT